jgi:hypothetical protein
MDKMGVFGEMLEKGQQTVQSTAKAAVSDVTNTVAGQIGVKPEASPDAQGKTQVRPQNQTQALPKTEPTVLQAASSSETLDLVKEFYAPSDDVQAPNAARNPQQEQAETQAKLAKLRQELHQSTYYDPLIAYETKKPQEEEAVAEKVEREEKEEDREKIELQQKKAKDTQDIATSRAQRATEANRGVAG